MPALVPALATEFSAPATVELPPCKDDDDVNDDDDDDDEDDDGGGVKVRAATYKEELPLQVLPPALTCGCEPPCWSSSE